MMNWGYGNQMLIYIHPKDEERHESKMGNNDLREQCDREDEEMRKRVSIVCIKLKKKFEMSLKQESSERATTLALER